MDVTIEQFVTRCQRSSSAAYEIYKQLLKELENTETRQASVAFLFQLKHYFEINRPQNCHFQFLTQTILDHNDASVNLNLLQFPSTFLPEEWSFTFYEGLIRYPLSEYQNRQVIELGCGIGWISIAIALRYLPAQIYGLDINPKAIVCARLNLYLNAYNADGKLGTLADGESLLDKVAFHESNLFSHFEQQTLSIDRVIGCIPQVLNPEPEVMENLIAESASDEYLHSLSNYFAKQGYIEDQFGLGLIASAVEQSIPILKSDGKLILNLGGRPGRSVLERLMQRRGFKVRRVWQTQVEQAADTEIKALVDIEKSFGHRFEFYMSANSDTPIDARTALEYSRAGGKIYHSVDVYEAEMLFPQQIKKIYQSVDQIGGLALRSAVDLTYDNFADAEERYSFLAFLAEQMQTLTHFPYEDTAGLLYFRQQLAEYFRYYLRVDISEQQLLITPGRRELIASLMTNYRPALTLIAQSLSSLVSADFDSAESQIIQVPSHVEQLVELINRLRPQCVITQLDIHEIQSGQLVAQLIHSAVEHNVLLVIDLTQNIELSSQPRIHGVYRYLSEHGLPGNIVIMAGLINNRVYQQYSLNITLTNNDFICKYLVDAAELTYSRTPVLKQLYYAHLLEELLFFQRTRVTSVMESRVKNIAPALPQALCENASAAFAHPAIQGNHLDFDKNTIRLDFGENELSAPALLKEVLFESYLVRRCVQDEISAEDALQTQLSHRFGFPQSIYSRLIFGNGVAPIFSALLNICAREKQTLVIPSGSYGYFNAAALYKGLSVCRLETDEAENFKITPSELEACLQQNQGCWMFLNAPIINPTGVIYSQSELSELLAIAVKYQVTVIMDSIFSGLEFNEDARWDLAQSIDRFNQSAQARFVMLGGISKEYAAGGLRFGYCWTTSKYLLHALSQEIAHVPHFTLGYAVRKLIRAHIAGEDELLKHQAQQKNLLSSRASLLQQTLTQNGWQVISPQGGLFLVAKPQALIKATPNLTLQQVGDLVTKQLFEQQNLVINNSTWTGLPGYCRFVLSCSQAEFTQAIERLSNFQLKL